MAACHLLARAPKQAHTTSHTRLQRLRAPVARIALVKPSKARSVEDMILNAARRGALNSKVWRAAAFRALGRIQCMQQALRLEAFSCALQSTHARTRMPPNAMQVTEEQLKGMLGQISEREAAATKITIQRRRPTFEDDD